MNGRWRGREGNASGEVGTEFEDDDDGGGVGAAGDGGGYRSSLRLLPVTIRELPYLNTMRYIVRVISYISPLNKHCLNI